MVRRLLLAVVLWSMVGAASHADSPLLLQRPTVNATEIVFVHGGDLWSVPRDGGAARRLTAGPGVETNPMFSPDGSTIAFTGEYDGNVDVYTMPAAGGVPKRLTWHPANDIALAWKPDGTRILFASSRESYVNVQQFYTVDLAGHFPEKLPLPMGAEASFSADATRLAYVPIGRAFTVWKQYRGGRTTPIWVATLANSRIDKVPRENSNDFSPMWVGDRVYFLSDREGAVTLFSYDTRSRRVRREITNRGLDIKSASAGPGAIVYEQFGSLRLFDVATGRDRSVPVTVNGDFPEVREKRVNVGRRLVNAHISPTGVRALFEARGEILSVPADKGDVRNFTNSTSVNERDPAWSPDGRTIAYFSDESGEYALHLAPQNGIGAVTKIAMPAPAFYYAPTWSPDSKKVAFLDSRLNIWYVDVESQKTVQVDRERYWAPGRQRQPAWSPDSKWLTYAKRLRNYLYAVHVYSLEGAKATQVTDGMSDARHVVFDKDGKYLYFSASTDIGPSLQPDVSSGALPSNRSVYLIVLDKRESSPFSPESDEEKPAEERPAGAPADTAKPPADTTKPQPPAEAAAADGAKPPAPAASRGVNVVIDFDNISQRILAMPFPARNYSGLQVGRAGVLYAIESAQGGALTVHRYDVKSRRTDIAVTGVNFFEVAWNGDKMLTRQGDNWFIRNVPPAPPAGAAPAAPPPPAANATPLQTAAIEVRTVPRDEWRQMFREAWRIERDFFYDPNLHGLDAKTAEKTYEPYLASVASRGDLNYLFAEMLGNIVVSHLGVGGGELPEVRRVQTGLLGADFSIEDGRYRFARVYNGENWNPDARAPLTQPGVNVVAGEYLLQVNGRDLTANDNVFSFFEATAGKNTLLRVGSDPSGTGARDVTVVPIPSDARLRNLAWIEGNRRKVDEATGGRVAYIYMPDTAFGGLTSFNRYFYAQLGKEAAIIDERFNGGGQLATDIIEQLARKPMSRVATRDGEDEEQPQGAIYGPKVMIINEYAGSGGDAMPNYFRRAGVGKLIGMRTWGGLVGRAGAPALMDGGIVSAPSSAVWDPATSQWDAENVGIAPDIEVEHDPELVRKGRDPQLERAIEEILAELKKSPQPRPKRPAYPNYHPKSASSTAEPAGRQ